MEKYEPKYPKWKSYAMYWTGYTLLFSLIQGVPSWTFPAALINELISLPPKVFFVAIVAEWLMDRLFLKGKIAVFFLWEVVFLCAFAILQRFIDNYIIIAYVLTHWEIEPLFSAPPLVYNAIKLQFVLAGPFSFRLFSHWSKEKSRAKDITLAQMQTELATLRTQFHPHFLFNVLNSLYAKILSGAPDSADLVFQISSLLRFSVYELNGKPIALNSEIAYLRNYIALQQTRFGDAIELSFGVEGNTEAQMVEPLLLLPFVENSFKYCMSDEQAKGWITIYIEANDGWLTARIENSIAQPALPANHAGVGLQQVKRRLELLYPDAYLLKIVPTAHSFFVLLKVKLQTRND